MPRNQYIESALKTFFLAIVAAIFFAYVPYKIATLEGNTIITEIGGVRFFGLIFILLGAMGYLACLRNFVVDAKSSPFPGDDQKHLIIKGLYRYVRNPIYISAYFIIFGEALFFNSLEILYYLMGWILFFHIFVVYIEEPGLRDKFGDSYTRYCDSVRRWIPRLKRLGKK